MQENGVFEVVSRTSVPQGKSVISSTWVFRVKHDKNGRVTRYKSRLCARGFQQVAGEDFHSTFAPVARLATFRALLAVAASRGYKMLHADVKCAFLHSAIDEDIFMEVPAGMDVPDGCVLKLRKSIYGLKQAPRLFNKDLHKQLLKIGFERTHADPCLYKLRGTELFVCLYVDDLLMVHAPDVDPTAVLNGLKQVFQLGSVEPLEYFLGFEISPTDCGLHVGQRRYCLDMLRRFGFHNSTPVATPAAVLRNGIKLSTGELLDGNEVSDYRAKVGSLLWLALGSRPDIAHAVVRLARLVKEPTVRALKACHRVFRYLRGTSDHALHYNDGSLCLEGQCDASWGNDLDTRRSYGGHLFKLTTTGALVSWRSSLQPTVATSSTCAEYMQNSEAAREAVWLRRLANDLGIPTNGPTVIQQDNEGARALTEDCVLHRRSKHIDIKYHHVRELVDRGVIVFKHVPTNTLAADVMTKPLSRPTFQRFVKQLFGDAPWG